MTQRPAHSWQRTMWVTFAVQLVSATGFSVMFPFLALYAEALGTRTSLSITFWAAMAYSGQALMMAIASPFWGRIADRRGHKLMLERATFGGCVVLVLMGFARSAEELALLRAVQGTVTGTIAAGNALVAAVVPRERMGYAMGVMQLGTWIGVAAGPLIGGVIADAVGYRAAFFVTAGCVLASGVLTYFGLPNAAPHAGAARPAPARWADILRAPGVLAVYGVRFLHQGGQTLLLPVLPLFVVSLLPGNAQVNTLNGLTIAVSSAAATLSAVWLGRLGDRVGHRRVLLTCLLLAGLSFLPLTLVTSYWQLLALTAVSGAATGGVIPSLAALLARLTPPGAEGAVYGIDNSVASGARAVMPLLAAALVGLVGLRGVIGLNGLVLLLGCAVALRAVPKLPLTGSGSGEPPAQGTGNLPAG